MGQNYLSGQGQARRAGDGAGDSSSCPAGRGRVGAAGPGGRGCTGPVEIHGTGRDGTGLAPPTLEVDRDGEGLVLEERPETSGSRGTRGAPAQQWLFGLAFSPVGPGNIHLLA